jgi:hypothetical protein
LIEKGDPRWRWGAKKKCLPRERSGACLIEKGDPRCRRGAKEEVHLKMFWIRDCTFPPMCGCIGTVCSHEPWGTTNLKVHTYIQWSMLNEEGIIFCSSHHTTAALVHLQAALFVPVPWWSIVVYLTGCAACACARF